MRTSKTLAVAMIVLISYAFEANAQLYFNRDNASELYTLDTTTATPTLVGTTGTSSATVGLTDSNDPNVLYASTWTQLSQVNLSAGTHSIVGTIPGGAEGLAWDSTAATLYGYINRDFFTLDPLTANKITDLANTPAEVEGIAYRAGEIFGFGGNNSNLYKYSVAGNSWSTVGDTSIPNADSSGLAYDPGADLLYAINENGALYSVDPNTAASTLIGNTGLNGGGLAFVYIPEPSSITLFAIGLVTLQSGLRRKASL